MASFVLLHHRSYTDQLSRYVPWKRNCWDTGSYCGFETDLSRCIDRYRVDEGRSSQELRQDYRSTQLMHSRVQ